MRGNDAQVAHFSCFYIFDKFEKCSVLFFHHHLRFIHCLLGSFLLSCHCCEVMSPWHKWRNILHFPCHSFLWADLWVTRTPEQGWTQSRMSPLSNYMIASREGELQCYDPLMLPNIQFLFILNLFVQRIPLMLTAPHHLGTGEGRSTSTELQAGKKSEVSPIEGSVR